MSAGSLAWANFWSSAVALVWGLPLVILLISSGLYLTLRSGLLPLRHWRHALDLLRGRYDSEDAPGEISHFQALAAALSATIGLGNIGGVAVAVSVGGPGAVFWMWIAGLVGMTTKFFTCTLACMYRREDSKGVAQGGPMYFLEVGLGPRFKPLSIFFSVCGMVGCLALFQINQLAAVLEDQYQIDRVATGLISAGLVGTVILGGVVRVGKVAARLVPAMGLLYILLASAVVFSRIDAVPGILADIIGSAFSGSAAAGGAAGVTAREALLTGVRRAAFSNEAGIGTAAMAHGAARTREPVREGLVAMIGPFIDTNIICTLTALVILSTGVSDAAGGATLTARAFESALSRPGVHLLSFAIVLFGLSTMISYAYYCQKCARYVLGESLGTRYVYVYLATIPLGAVWAQATVVNILDTAFALMAIPTLVGTLLLSPRVVAKTRDYFSRIDRADPAGPDQSPSK